MAAETERFWPSLRDRLRSEGTDGLPLDDHFLTAEQLREHVKRDLENLFNVTNLETTEDLSGAPRVRRSILNYGIPDLTGRLSSGVDAGMLERRLRDIILAYEPRMKSDTVAVRIRTLTENGQVDPERPIQFEISGEIFAAPVNERIFLRSTWDVELNTATVEVE